MTRLRPVFVVALMLCISGIAAHAQQVTLDFQNLSNPSPGNANNGDGNDQGFVITQNGFTVRDASATAGLHSVAPNPAVFNYTGSVALFNNFVDGITSFARSDGGLFTLNSIDTANSLKQSTIPVGIGATFTGNLQGGGTVIQTYTHGANDNLETVVFGPGFSNLLSVRIDVAPAAPAGFFQFDNIVVTAVPEPGSVALLTVSTAGGIFALRRRKRA